jgi:hypothetical protein
MTDQPLTDQQLDEIESIAARVADDPFYVSDCEGSLQVWREKALTHVRRDAAGEIEMYSLPSTYKVTDQIIELDLSTWDPGEDETDDQQRQDVNDLVDSRAALPALLVEVRRLRARVAELEVGLNDLAALVSQWYDRSEKAQARIAELEGPAVEARAALADAVVEWSGQTVGCHVPTVDAIVELINPQSEPRVCGDQLVDWACSLRDGRHLDGKHRDEFNGAWWDQSSVPPYSNRARVAAEESGVQG